MMTARAMPRGGAFWVASFGGSGLSPVAPGTVGSAVALVLGMALLALEPALLPLAAAVATMGGLWAVQACQLEGDPGWVVIDEVAGQWIALLPLALLPPGAEWNLPSLALAFLAFRALDILKPGPVGWADRQEGAAGIMADDVIAGLLAAALVRLAQVLLPEWFTVPMAALTG
jgi:phosphatidylglycerophosphatase A